MPTLNSLNALADRWRWVLSLVGLLGIMGVSVAWPGQRISRLEEQHSADHAALVATTQYLRVLATAQCLSDSTPRSNLMALMCSRVLSDQTIFAPPQ